MQLVVSKYLVTTTGRVLTRLQNIACCCTLHKKCASINSLLLNTGKRWLIHVGSALCAKTKMTNKMLPTLPTCMQLYAYQSGKYSCYEVLSIS